MACETVWYSNAFTGLPTLSGTVGELLAVLDACLVNGSTPITLGSLVVASGVATATYGSGHTYPQYGVVEIAGATPSELNGRKRILSVTGTTFTFDATGISDQTASGTITAKIPAAGWEIAYSGTNKKAYRALGVGATGGLLQVDDTVGAGAYAKVRGFMGMTDVNTGTDQFPTDTQVSSGGYWNKSSAANTTQRNWTLVADDRFIYFVTNYDGSTVYKAVFFGDFVNYAPADPWGCVITLGSTPGATSYPGYTDGSTSNARLYLPRIFEGTGTSVLGAKKCVTYQSAKTNLPYPSPVSGGILATDLCMLFDGAATSSPSTIRGQLPGYVMFLNDCSPGLSWNTPILLDGYADAVLPIPTGDTAAPWFGVKLGDWR